MDHIRCTNADVIGLCEVDTDPYQQVLVEGLKKIGYESIVREKPDGPTGSLIAFKPEKVTFISDGYL